MQVSIQPYELLIRWLPTGELSGAHCIKNTVVINDDDTLTIVPGEPKPLDIAGPEFTSVVGIALSASQANVTALQAQVSGLQSQVAELQSQIPTQEQ
jgi:hypothetical protein